jgi:hypothetical protein
MHSIGSTDYPTPLTPQELKQQTESALRAKKVSMTDKNQKPTPRIVPVPASSSASNSNNDATTTHARNGSSESLVSSRSSNSRPSSVSAPITLLLADGLPNQRPCLPSPYCADALCHSSLPIVTPVQLPPHPAPPRQSTRATTSPTTRIIPSW